MLTTARSRARLALGLSGTTGYARNNRGRDRARSGVGVKRCLLRCEVAVLVVSGYGNGKWNSSDMQSRLAY